MTKILLYNWSPVDGKNGGGVELYQRNLAEALIKDGSYEIYHLDSGIAYTRDRKTRIVKIGSAYGEAIHTYELLNSPVLAPVQQTIKNLRNYLFDEKIYQLLKQFIKDAGGFDIIHFNNLEGLSLKTLELKKEFPETKFIYSIHNYFPVCSRVNLWKDEHLDGGHNCDKASWEECAKCYSALRYELVVLNRRHPKFPGIGKLGRIAAMLPEKEDARLYEQFEKQNIAYINSYVDCVLAVSKRVKDILVSRGVEESKVHVSYIGTAVAQKQMKQSNADITAEPFRLIYMGYMRRDKGFYFFIEALNKMPDDLARKCAVRFVARHTREQTAELAAIDALKLRFAEVELINGYSKENQQELLQGMHLGVVPVMWEDNLPQVAIEQIAYGVPILSSNLGGASELCKDERFVFEAGNHQQFIDKLEYLVQNRDALVDFWNHTMQLVSMNQHVEELKHYYSL